MSYSYYLLLTLSFFYLSLLMLCSMLVFFFFFKQKTAYEMRISDWSSDVCSSDLDAEFVVLIARAMPGGHIGIVAKAADDPALVAKLAKKAIAITQIGRAACRERVCQ